MYEFVIQIEWINTKFIDVDKSEFTRRKIIYFMIMINRLSRKINDAEKWIKL